MDLNGNSHTGLQRNMRECSNALSRSDKDFAHVREVTLLLLKNSLYATVHCIFPEIQTTSMNTKIKEQNIWFKWGAE